MNPRDDEKLVRAAIAQAEQWQQRANKLLTGEEKSIQRQLQRLLDHPMDKVVMAKMIDQSFRSENDRRVADQINQIFEQNGVPDFFTSTDKLLMRLFLGVGRHFPHVSVPRVIEKMREDSSRSVIPGEKEVLGPYLKRRFKEGVQVNINHLGEALLGEEEAAARLETYLTDLADPAVAYMSVKISTIYSQISSLAFEHTLGVLVERLSKLYRAAGQHQFTTLDGSRQAKFINLDMEEYRDLEITAAAFQRTLDQEEFFNHSAGIVLQAYLPDSWEMQQRLTKWAANRVQAGGAPIKLRIVKGANMEMEQVEAALNNWPLAPYDNKLDVDANFKRMVEYALRPEHGRAVHVGVASHNLFELAYAYTLAKDRGVTDIFSFEMLEGMADHVRRAIQETNEEMVLYAPVATREQFISAIAYLIRRLDENTGPENFLRYAADLEVGAEAWVFLERGFREACAFKDMVGDRPHRVQDRNKAGEGLDASSAHRARGQGRGAVGEGRGTYFTGEFVNEADTDWAVANNRAWAEGIKERWGDGPLIHRARGQGRGAIGEGRGTIPIVVGGEEVFEGHETREIVDSSLMSVVGRYALAGEKELKRAVAVAREDLDGWRELSLRDRHRVLSDVAVELRKARGDLIGACAAGTGKVFGEADVEVSEAVDFAEYYPFSVGLIERNTRLKLGGKGVGLVISPWNFPVAIPCGGIVAALAAGNTVLFKPASNAVLPAWVLCECFWRAGVSRNVLQFLPCAGVEAGRHLVNTDDVDFIILTGGTDTGMGILAQRPDVYLAAETGGKNATIVTAMSDREQAIKNVVHSAFGNCGQKCSATSLLILEEEVYGDEGFKRTLADAVQSVAVGAAWDFASRMGPLIHPPKGELLRALTILEEGESWLVEPMQVGDNPYLWSPGVKWGVRPGSVTHMTEFFGPVIGVMRARDLVHAIELANQVAYGLTSGLESLDEREQEVWKEKIEAGNLYINRGTTGAIVLRQPFGGMKKSALGAGIKAGGPNYVAQFMNAEETGFPEVGAISRSHRLLELVEHWRRKVMWGQLGEVRDEIEKVARAVKSYLYWFEQEFGVEKDYFHLRGQDNLVRYRPVGIVVVRVHGEDSLFEVLGRVAAGMIAGCGVQMSLPKELDNGVTWFLKSGDGVMFIGDSVEAHRARGKRQGAEWAFGPSGEGQEVIGDRRRNRDLFKKPVEVVIESDGELAGRLGEVDRVRYAGRERVPEVVYAAAAKIGFYIARGPVLMEGRLELLNYFREQSVCYNYHRYGNVNMGRSAHAGREARGNR